MSELKDTYFQQLRRPKIVMAEETILIIDRPIPFKIFMVIFCMFLTTIAYYSDKDNKDIGIFIGLSLSLFFIFDSIALKRTKIDLKQKIVYRKSLNPIENWYDHLLQHPGKIPFTKIEKIFTDYKETSQVKRYYLYLRTEDPYNLKIGTFDKESDALNVAGYLNKVVRR